MSVLSLLSTFAAFLLISPAAGGERTSLRPLRQTELLALVAGNVLPENLVAEIHARGLAFTVDDSFRAYLKRAGADATILGAANGAKRLSPDPEYTPEKELLERLSKAGQLIRERQFDKAADEVTPALTGNFEKYEIGFVAGEILQGQERWQEAAMVYREVLNEAPDFPEAHTKLSFILYRLGDGEESLREARAALARTPENAEAHKNAGLALSLLRKTDAAVAECKEALRIKPDYASAHQNLGVILNGKGDYDGAISEYQKASTLDRGNAETHYDLGRALDEKNQRSPALREYREAIRLNPNYFDARHKLASVLMGLGMYREAVAEFRELETRFPNSEVCHLCLGRALYMTSDFDAATVELRKAAAMDPADPSPLLTIGAILEDKKNYDGALDEYRKAETLSPELAEAHMGVGRVMLAEKNAAEAVKELKQATDLEPSNAYMHDLYAQALQLSGNVNAAIREFKDSLALDPKQIAVMLELASALEKQGDWAAELEEYRQAAVAENLSVSERTPGVSYREYSAAQKYKEAQERFTQQIALLKKAGKATEAERLAKSIQDQENASSAGKRLDTLMLSGSQALSERRYDDAEREYQQALPIAEKLQPLDTRLLTILNHLGQLALYRRDYPAAEALFERQLKLTEQMFGTRTANLTQALKFLAMTLEAEKDFPAAERFAERIVEINKNVYGDNSEAYVNALRIIATVYTNEQKYDKAEPYLLEGVQVEAKLYNYDPRQGGIERVTLISLCNLYEVWKVPSKMEACDGRLIAILEGQGGPDTHLLEQVLGLRANALRLLKRNDEADAIEKRLKALQPQAAVTPQ